jgi:hypothetical protein
MNTEPVHPMVMKAARVFGDQESDVYGIDRKLHWDLHRHRLIPAAQAALTDCGALECLEALEAYECAQTNDDSDAAHMLAHSAIAKVYGSAPE